MRRNNGKIVNRWPDIQKSKIRLGITTINSVIEPTSYTTAKGINANFQKPIGMFITREVELIWMQEVSEAVATTLKEMKTTQARKLAIFKKFIL